MLLAINITTSALQWTPTGTAKPVMLQAWRRLRRLHLGDHVLLEFFERLRDDLRIRSGRHRHYSRHTQIRERLEVVRARRSHHAGEFYRGGIASGRLRFGSHQCKKRLQFFRIHRRRKEPVAKTTGASRGGGRIAADMNRDIFPYRFWIRVQWPETEMLALERRRTF